MVLLYAGEVDESELREQINASELPPLMRPSALLKVDAIPKLGSGKSDFKRAKQLAEKSGA